MLPSTFLASFLFQLLIQIKQICGSSSSSDDRKLNAADHLRGKENIKYQSAGKNQKKVEIAVA